MFAPPKEIQAEVFARLPETLRKTGTRSSWADANQHGRAIDSFLEGPSFDLDGSLYVTDIPHGRIFRVSREGEFALVAEYDGEPNGLKLHRDGRIFIADYRRGIVELDPLSGRITPRLERYHSESFKGINDLVFASNGDLYFTDQGQTGLHDPSGRVFRWCADGRLDLLVSNVPSPNGLVLNPQENVLYVAATRGNCVWRVPLQADGGTSKVGLFIQLSGGWGGPDGLAMDVDGGLLVAHAGLGCVWHFNPLGEPLHRIISPAGLATTNMAFGGERRDELYITESESGSILRARLPVQGRPPFSHQQESHQQEPHQRS